jgi:hypothetical protein
MWPEVFWVPRYHRSPPARRGRTGVTPAWMDLHARRERLSRPRGRFVLDYNEFLARVAYSTEPKRTSAMTSKVVPDWRASTQLLAAAVSTGRPRIAT